MGDNTQKTEETSTEDIDADEKNNQVHFFSFFSLIENQCLIMYEGEIML